MNCGAVISKWETHEKMPFGREEIYPKFSILDPQNTFSVPKDQTAYGIVDAFSHVLEQYLHTTTDVPLQDRFSESILLTLIENAPLVLKNLRDYHARANIMLSATMALNNLISIGTNEDWACHSIEHQFSAFYDIPHGAGLAIITSRWMEVVKKQKKRKFFQYGQRIWNLRGSEKKVVDDAIQATDDFFKSLGVKMSLGEWKIGSEHFGIMTERLVKRRTGEKALNRKQTGLILNGCLV